jgi:two-component system nitrogen regulation response regulator GlnG
VAQEHKREEFNMAVLLIVDDEKNVLYSLEKGLRPDGYEILTADTARRGIELVGQSHPDVVLLDVRLPDMSGLDAFHRMREIDPRLPVIIMTAHGTTDTAIKAMKSGAYEYLLKPVKLNELRQIVARAIEVSRLSRVPAVFDQTAEPVAADHIVGTSRPMQRVYKDIGRIAGQDVNVLILGESGTGKELVARAIFHHSSRSKGPFLAINAAAIPETLLESELFGHERGSFTGADRRRIGKFEQADHGTLFLDEIGDMPLATQAKVLRLLQDGRFERVGGNETIQTDVRVIAATNQDMGRLIEQGRFRQDLYYRLRVFTIELPPLRERADDLPLLLEHFIKLYNRELGKSIRSVSEETFEVLRAHSWPGNVRELQSAVKYALVHACGNVLTPDCLPESCGSLRPSDSTAPSPPDGTAEDALEGEQAIGAVRPDALDVSHLFAQLVDQGHPHVYHAVERAVQRFLLTEALQRANGNQVEASRLLGISRTTLRAKLESLGLYIEKQVVPK